MSKITIILMLVTGALATVTVGAQNTLFLRESPIAWLDDTDQAILSETIDAVMEAPDGTTTDWLNPETGAKGRVQVTDTHEDFGTTCRRLRMRNEAKGRQGGGNYRLCLAEDGRWKFAPNDDTPMKESAPADDS